MNTISNTILQLFRGQDESGACFAFSYLVNSISGPAIRLTLCLPPSQRSFLPPFPAAVYRVP